MPYAPGIDYHGDAYLNRGIAGAGQAIAGAIDENKKKREQMEKEGAFNNQIVQHAYESGRISEEELNKYLAASHTAKQGIANGYAANMADDFARQKFAAQQDQSSMARDLQERIANMRNGATNTFQDVPAAVAARLAAENPNYSAMPTGRGGVQYLPKPSAGRKNDATFGKINSDVRAASGASITDWRGSQNQRIEGDNVVGELPPSGKLDVFGRPEPGRTLRIPVDVYKTSLEKYNALSGIDAPVVLPPLVKPSAAAPAGDVNGGYIPGRRYNGRKFKGGDPSTGRDFRDPASWE